MTDAIKIETVEMGGFTAALVGFVNNHGWDDGLAYLRVVGTENAVRAIWARLSGDRRKKRRKAEYHHEVDVGGGAVKTGAVRYHTIATRLPCGQLDLVMLHPYVTSSNAGPNLVFIADKDHEGPPPGWFERLNAACKLPLKEEWAELLWEKGLEGVITQVPYEKMDYFDKKKREWVYRTEYREEKLVPIRELKSKGNVQGYQVQAGENVEPAWLAIIRGIL